MANLQTVNITALRFCVWQHMGKNHNETQLQPTRPHENHGLAMEHLPTQLESHQKPQLKSFAVPAQGSLVKSSKIQGMQECT